MPKRLIDVGREPGMLLDIASYARRGPGRRDRLSQEEIELISRTVRRTPEVMVKVLSRGWRDLKAVARHLGYLNRGGDVEIETDDGRACVKNSFRPPRRIASTRIGADKSREIASTWLKLTGKKRSREF
jgi:hypothetical protein